MVRILVTVLFLLLFSPVGTLTCAERSPQFSDLLKEGGLEFRTNKHLSETTLPRSSLYSFEKALKHDHLPLKIFYAVRPLARMRIDYNDPHSNAPDPNQVFPLVFEALISTLAHHGANPSRIYPPQKAKALFNADWAAASLFDTDPAIGSGYKSALLIAIHKHKRADAYILFVFDSARLVKPAIDKALSTLRFKE